jgi:Methyltransferase FkbM domain
MVEPDETNLRAGIENFKFNNLNGKFINSFVAKDRFEVDTFLQNENIDRLDILHSDVQGYEIEMLDGCKMTLSEKRTDYLFISTHSQALHEEALEKVASFGYRIEISSNFESETTSCDGLIFASSPNIPQALGSFVPLTREQLTNAKPNEIFDYLAQIRTQVKHTR